MSSQAQIEVQPEVNTQSESITVLFIDDDISARIIFKRKLEHYEGLKVLLAENLQEGLDKQDQADCILCDVRLPDEDINKLKLFRKSYILISSSFDPQFCEEAAREGSCGYLLKNSPPEQFVATIRHLVEKTKSRKKTICEAIERLTLLRNRIA